VGFYAALVLASSLFWAGMGQINRWTWAVGHDDHRPVRLLMAQRDGAAPRAAQLDAAVLGRHGAGGAVQGPDRHRAAGRRAGAVHLFARLGDLEALHLVKGLICSSPSARPGSWRCRCAIPEFPQFFFIHEHFQRFTTKIHSRRPWYYFIPMLVLGIMPWLGVFFQSQAP
jgi:hypothetical protein